jgi:hypothetical protein
MIAGKKSYGSMFVIEERKMSEPPSISKCSQFDEQMNTENLSGTTRRCT